MNASDIDLSSAEFWAQPLDVRDRAFDVLRQQKPVSWQSPPSAFAPPGIRPPRGYWAVTRYEDIRRVHRDSKTFSAASGTFLFDNMSLEDEYAAAGMMGTDPPRHTKLRALVESTFTARTLARMRSTIDQRALELVARYAPLGGCDFKEMVAPLPRLLVCDLLGIPEEDRNEIGRLVHLVTAGSGPDGFEVSMQASRDIANYSVELARKRAQVPQDDLLTLLVNAEIDGERLSEPDLGAMANLLIVAGIDTSAAALTLSLIALDKFPAERARLLEDFPRYTATAAEEMLRWSTPGAYIRRVATQDTLIGEQQIAKGDNVVLWFRSGNRDEQIFAKPYTFDVARSPNPHLAFGGGGRHFCIGNELARMEIKSMWAALLKYLPDIHHIGTPTYLPTPQYVLTDGPLPCRFTPCQVL